MWLIVVIAAAGEVGKFLAATLPLVIGILGLGGLVFTALRFRRDDTTAILTQQNTIMGEMKTLNDELRTSVTSLREERDQLRTQVESLTGEITSLRGELEKYGGTMTRIEDKLDNGSS